MTDPRIPEALTGGPRRAARDPLHWCVFATVSLLTWALGPAVLARSSPSPAWSPTAGPWSRGRRTSRCLLRDTRLVLLYLGLHRRRRRHRHRPRLVTRPVSYGPRYGQET